YPAKLLFARAAHMGFRDGDGQPIALPGLDEQRFDSWRRNVRNADRLHVGVNVTAVAAVKRRREPLAVVVQVPIARDVVVDPDDVRRARGLAKDRELALRYPKVAQPLLPRMHVVDTA